MVGCVVELQATSVLALVFVFVFVFFWFINTLRRYEVEVERKYERLVVWSSSKPHQSVICGGSTWEGHRDILLRNLIIPNRLIDQSINIVFNSFCSYSFLAGSKIKCLLGASKRNIYLDDGVTRQSLKMVFVYRFKHVLNQHC